MPMTMGSGHPVWPLLSGGDMSEQLKAAQADLKAAEGADDPDEGLLAVLREKVADLADAEEAAKAASKAAVRSSKAEEKASE